ncbi:glycoside hydrolase family 5 protein [Fusarium oxysporum Fo47]|uniref:glycoside hydrolase family 5 protein n=1 Tax=Fusarium oxysporum Fo47 TaxID=660027 RepID=UPI002869E2F8|nr:glycoside hydrolase family 5 protein [Fusarium oxysporum Fo47]QKD62186.2 glycoside hydrolase family 5 protein [Fusarium oxysporum Fo47]
MLFSIILSVLAAHAGLALGDTSVTVNTNKRLQVIDGFGVSEAYGHAKQFQNLGPGPQKEGLDLLFNTTTGAGLSIIRNKIGCDDSNSITSTNTDNPAKQPVFHFDGDDDGQVWFSKQAMRYGVETIYANAWSAPLYMKSAKSMGRLCGTPGVSCASGDWRHRYVEIIVQYLSYYKEAGIPVSHVGFLNEGDGSDFMLSSAEQAADVIPLLHSALNSKGLGDIKMTCCDNIGWKSQMEYTAKLAELGVESYLSVITSHEYSSSPDQPMNTTLPTWMSEGAANDQAFATAWYVNGGSNEGFTWAVKIAQGIVNADLSAYIYWEGVETNNRGSLSHVIDTDGTKFTISSILWAIAHWSRHIRPGAHRLSTSGVVQDTIVGAFENVDGSVVLVLTNTGTAAQTVDLGVTGSTFSTAQAFTSDDEAQMVNTKVTVSDNRVKVTVPVHGVVTVKLTTAKSSNPLGSPKAVFNNTLDRQSSNPRSGYLCSRVRQGDKIPRAGRNAQEFQEERCEEGFPPIAQHAYCRSSSMWSW